MTKMALSMAMSVAGLVGACANLPSGGRETVRFISDPPGALATLSIGSSCETPCQISVSRMDEFSVTFSKPGYSSRTVGVVSDVPTLSGGVSVVPGVRFGLSNTSTMADPTGNFRREHRPNPVTVKLEPSGITGTGQ